MFRKRSIYLTAIVCLCFSLTQLQSSPQPIYRLSCSGQLANTGSLPVVAEWKNPIAAEAGRLGTWDKTPALDFMASPTAGKAGNPSMGGALIWKPAPFDGKASGTTLLIRFEMKGMAPNGRLFTSPLFNLLPYPSLFITTSGVSKNLGLKESLPAGVWWLAVSIRFEDGLVELHSISDEFRHQQSSSSITVGPINPLSFQGPFEIGNHLGTRPFRGYIDQVQIYDVPLKSEEILDLLPASLNAPSEISFIPFFHPDLPSEKVWIEPGVWGALRKDEELGLSSVHRLRAPSYRRTYSYPPQTPHSGLQLCARTTGASTEVAFEVRGFSRSRGKSRRVLLRSKKLYITPASHTYRLEYAQDFEPSADAAEFVGESIQSIVVTADVSQETDLVLSDIRAVSVKDLPRIEIRRVLHTGHVLISDSPGQIGVEVYSPAPAPGVFLLNFRRQDGLISKVIERKVSLSSGEHTILLNTEELPRGYYSVAIELSAGDQRAKSGSHLVVVPPGQSRVLAWNTR
jgi:hypothetical protein